MTPEDPNPNKTESIPRACTGIAVSFAVTAFDFPPNCTRTGREVFDDGRDYCLTNPFPVTIPANTLIQMETTADGESTVMGVPGEEFIGTCQPRRFKPTSYVQVFPPSEN